MDAQKMWELYAKKADIRCGYDVWAYGDDPDGLAKLTLEGKKTATASAYALYELEGETLPSVGEYSVILDSREEAVCVIRTERVFVTAFRDVDEVQAMKEGEGDGSLAYWRKVHKTFFAKELREAGLEFDEDMKVLCEEFICVYP